MRTIESHLRSLWYGRKGISVYSSREDLADVSACWLGPSPRSTDSNLGIAIASLVICVVRGVTGRLRYSPWLAEVIYDLMLFVLWTTSILRQLSGDFSDPDHPSQHPWYLTHSCRASWEANRTFCGIAQASFVTSVLALLINSWRLVSDAVQAFRRARNNTWEKLEDDIETKLDSADLQPGTEFYDYRDEALSPILAFFVENTRVQHWGWSG